MDARFEASDESDSNDALNYRRPKAQIIRNPPRSWRYIGDEIKLHETDSAEEDISLPGIALYNENEIETGWPIYFERDQIDFSQIDEEGIKFKDWNNAYIFLKNTAELYFIRDYKVEKVDINDINKFIKLFKEIMLPKGLVYTMKHLNVDQVYKLITTNSGHTPYTNNISDQKSQASRTIKIRQYFTGLFSRIGAKVDAKADGSSFKPSGK